jgi:glutamate synthase (NADPH/NADH) large chain
MEMVDLDPLLEADLNLIYQLLTQQKEYTNSDRATYMLQNWKKIQQQFIKVMPKEYKRVLEAKKAEELALA